MGDDKPSYTLDEAISEFGFGKFHVFALFFAGIGYFSDAMEISLLSFIGPVLRTEWSLSHTQESLLTTAVFMGMLPGAFFWGYLSDTCGRKIGIRCVSTIVLGAGILSAFSPNYTLLVILRIAVGFGVSGGHVFLSWFLEFIPSSNRGSLTLVLIASWVLGEALEVSLAWVLSLVFLYDGCSFQIESCSVLVIPMHAFQAIMPRFGWRWLIIVSSFPALTALLLSGFAPESPRYLFMKGRIHETCEILKNVASINGKEVLNHQPASESFISEGNHLLPQKNTKTGCLETIRQLFSASLMKTTLLLWTMHFAYTFIYFGIQLMISSLSSQNDCGVANTLVGDKDDRLYVNTLITCAAELPGLIIATLFIDSYGRKICMELLSLLTVISILPLVSLQNGALISALLIIARMFISAAFSTLIIYAEEVYPTGVRATGIGLMSAVGGFGGMVCPLVAIGLVRGCHLSIAITLFAGVIVVSGVCVLLFPFETKGRELTDIVQKNDEVAVEN